MFFAILNTKHKLLIIFIIVTQFVIRSDSIVKDDFIPVRVNKCCELKELYVDDHCRSENDAKEKEWKPLFTSETGVNNLPIKYVIITGLPDCKSHQHWGIHHYENSSDVLRLLPNGNLRHYIHRSIPTERLDALESINKKKIMSYDFEPGQYCLDKHIKNDKVTEFALVCGPDIKPDWTNTDFLMRNIINPITHIISITCFLIVSTIFFIMPTLRDLVGNIVTTISLCLIVSQAADLIRLLTIFTSHVSLIIIEAVCYVSLLGAFFWINSLAYYIWKTFKSRNVYLRITDSKKYCYYSTYAWSCTGVMGFLAIFAHYTMDYDTEKPILKIEEQEQIGSLGMIIFFMPVAFTVIVNIFFMATTLKILSRMNTYGRIHHKLRHSFRMFILLFLVMTITWIFFLMSFSKFDGLIYTYIIINAFQAPLFLYICIFNQQHVSFLLRKTCCYADCFCSCCRPENEIEWGDEMTAMHNGIY